MLVLRKTGGWIELEVPAVAVVIVGVVRSRSRVLGVWPRPTGFSLISFLGTSVYCGFCQSACAMVLPPIWAVAVVGISGALGAQGSGDLNVISFLLRPFVLIGWYSYFMYLCMVYLLYWSLYVFLNV